jgi:hypothetical protein
MNLIRYLLPRWLAGCLAGMVGATALVATNFAGLRDLMWHTPGGGLAFALLVFGFIVTFSSMAVGAAIMGLGGGEE